MAGKLKSLNIAAHFKLKTMRRLFIGCLVVMLISCGTSETGKENSESKNNPEGNSAGEAVIARDTMRMDTSSKSISPR